MQKITRFSGGALGLLVWLSACSTDTRDIQGSQDTNGIDHTNVNVDGVPVPNPPPPDALGVAYPFSAADTTNLQLVADAWRDHTPGAPVTSILNKNWDSFGPDGVTQCLSIQFISGMSMEDIFTTVKKNGGSSSFNLTNATKVSFDLKYSWRDPVLLNDPESGSGGWQSLIFGIRMGNLAVFQKRAALITPGAWQTLTFDLPGASAKWAADGITYDGWVWATWTGVDEFTVGSINSFIIAVNPYPGTYTSPAQAANTGPYTISYANLTFVK